jgi:hypothetical protein
MFESVAFLLGGATAYISKSNPWLRLLGAEVTLPELLPYGCGTPAHQHRRYWPPGAVIEDPTQAGLAPLPAVFSTDVGKLYGIRGMANETLHVSKIKKSSELDNHKPTKSASEHVWPLMHVLS